MANVVFYVRLMDFETGPTPAKKWGDRSGSGELTKTERTALLWAGGGSWVVVADASHWELNACVKEALTNKGRVFQKYIVCKV